MKPHIKLFLSLLTLLALAAPVVGFAHDIGLPYWGNPPILSCNTERDATGNITNPCRSLCDLLHTFQHIVYFGITLVLFVIAPVMFLWGGILVLTSGGSEKRLTMGRDALRLTAIGVAVTLGAFLIVNTFLMIVGAKIGTGGIHWSTIECPANLPGTIRNFPTTTP